LEYGLWATLTGLTAVSAAGVVMPALRLRTATWAPAFAAGGVAGALAFHILPAALRSGGSAAGFFVLGLVVWALIHRLFHGKTGFKATAATYLIGDGLHNFLDGGALAVAFSHSYDHGIWLATAVFAHEITQEWAEWGLLLHAGFRPRKILLWNLTASLMAFVGAAVVLFALPAGTAPQAALNGLLAANFLFVLVRMRNYLRPYAWLLAGFLASVLPHWFLSH
jgi:zinc transporter ZupT